MIKAYDHIYVRQITLSFILVLIHSFILSSIILVLFTNYSWVFVCISRVGKNQGSRELRWSGGKSIVMRP